MSDAEKILAEEINVLFGQATTKMIFSKHWQSRQRALQRVHDDLQQFDGSQLAKNNDADDLLVGVLKLVNKGLLDKVIQVNLDAIQLLKVVINGPLANIQNLRKPSSQVEYGRQMNMVIDNMLDRLGDGNRALVRQCEDTVVEATRNPLIGYDMVIERIISQQAIQMQL